MPKVEVQAKEWQKALAERVGEAVKSRRTELGWSAVTLTERTKELGYPVSRVAIGKLENGHREGKFDLAELLTLAMALKVPPVALLFGGHPDQPVELLPGLELPAGLATAWFSGEVHADLDPDARATKLLRLTRKRAEMKQKLRWIQSAIDGLNDESRSQDPGSADRLFDDLIAVGQLMDQIAEIDEAINEITGGSEQQ